jgi:predicted cobalt transporter CbtA
MVGILLLRGMLAGVLAGLVCFAFLKLVGEPSLDRAIAFESASHSQPHDHAHDAASAADHHHDAADHHDHGADEELVSRAVQSGLGLFIGVVVYSAAFGGLFALAFAFAYGRIDLDARGTAALLAALAFVALYLVPGLKYPANPPSVGAAETIGARTALYFAMMAVSLAAMIAAAMLRKLLADRLQRWNATIVAGLAYLALVALAAAILPAVDEVPQTFPATVLWQFRVASLGGQLLMWATIGLAFGFWTARADHAVRPRLGASAS